MTFDKILAQVLDLLQRQGRVSYRALKRRFELDDEYIEDLKAEIIDAQQLAIDEDGKVLVWVGRTTQTGGQKPEAKAKPAKRKAKTEKRGRAKTQKPRVAQGSSLSARRGAPEAERRQLTVMFCDLVGSTALSEQLDPEELREVVRAYQEVCAGVIHSFEGHIAQYLGDGLLVYFGYPAAHEDDASRAVRTGLGIVEEMHTLNARLEHSLQVRIGIHTGLVVVGEMGGGGRHEQLALGDTPNVAARVQGKAEPDEVLISAATHRLVEGLFECEDRGSHELKGVSIPVLLYRVMGEGAARSRFEVAVRTGLTPLVGREGEVRFLQQHWEKVQGGEGQAVMLNGEPGVGKSRLVQELKEQVVREGATRIEFQCSPYHQNSALYPVIEHLQQVLQFQRDDSPQVKLEKLENTLSQYRFPQADTGLLIAALLSLPRPDAASLMNLDPQRRKQKTLEALVAWLLEEAERQSVYCTWEDLHWADPSTLELLSLLIDQVPTACLYFLLTFRPEFSPPWGARSYLSQLTLGRLGRKQVEGMVEQVTGGRALPMEVVQQIAAKTDGVPLFVEELTKTVVESGILREVDGHYELTGPLPSLAIPATLQDSLIARLDRLSPAKEVAQLGATLGREFSYELIQAVSLLDEETLQQGLSQLVGAELVYQRGLPPQARYIFKHALIQDAAYQSLLRSKRQQYHQEIAQVLEEQLPETVETQPELVAHHYTEAGLVEQAIPYWQKAGQKAAQASAHIEAIGHLTKGLELLKTLPDTPERIQQELTLQITLGAPLMATKGYAAPEVGATYTRARDLCRQVGQTPQLFPVLWGLCGFYSVRAEWQTAQELAEQLFTLAQSVQDSALLLEAHYALGQALYIQGEFVLGREHFEQVVKLYDPQQHRSLAFVYGLEPGVMGRGMLSTALWFLGYPDQARKMNHAALTLGQEVSHSTSLAFALNCAVGLYLFCRDEQTAQERAEAEIILATEHGFALWLAFGMVVRGWALAAQGQVEEGIAQIRQGLAAHRATGAESMRSRFLALLAWAYGEAGQAEEGLSLLAEALALVNKTGECSYEAEIYRLKGELLRQKAKGKGGSPPGQKAKIESEAEECFHQALDIARRQSAKSLELRAAMSLSRLWQKQGKKEQARQMLAKIYGWFTEGFDTKDLQEAKALLNELA